MTARLRVLALVPSLYDTSPGQRYRLEQWEALLRASDIEVTFAPFECERLNTVLYQPSHVAQKVKLVAQAFARRFALLRSVREYDVVYVFREAALLGPPVFERWIARSGVPMIFDFDDAIFVRYRSPSNGYLSWLKFPSKTRAICRWSDHVMAGNAYLAAYARQANPRVTIVPTTIDTDKYRVDGPPAPNDVPVIGWTGTLSTLQHLNLLRDVFRRLATKEAFRLVVIAPAPYAIDGVDVEFVPWRARTEVADLRRIDVGVMPVPDDAWSRGKCGCKALQYMALGVPAVCSPVGVNTEIVQDGVNGFLAHDHDEWMDRLTRLLQSPDLRQRLGRAGRLTVEAQYSAAVQAPRVADIFHAVHRSRHATALPAGDARAMATRR